MKPVKACSFFIIGMGNIGSILVQRLVEIGISTNQIMVADTDDLRVSKIVNQFGVIPSNLAHPKIKLADVIVLATPPKTIVDLLNSLSENLEANQMVISMAAAVSLERIRSVVRQDVPVVRILPNPPSLLGKGMNPVAFELSAAPEIKDFTFSLLEVLGDTIEVQDEQMTWCVGLTGAAMRSVLPVLEGMTQAGVEAGLSLAESRRVAAKIMAGTAAMAIETDLPLDQIRTLTPMQTLDEKMISDLFQATARNTKEKVDATQAKLMEN
jgi:pyrroline-5-carboxylate reductase